jgi:hypothetical protein
MGNVSLDNYNGGCAYGNGCDVSAVSTGGFVSGGG